MMKNSLLNWVRAAFALWLPLIVLVASSGCSSSLIVESDPPGATIRVSRDDQPQGGQTKASPHRVTVDFDKNPGRAYTITATPPDSLLEKYETTTTRVDGVRYNALPVAGKNSRKLIMALGEKDYGEVPIIEIVLDARLGWVGVLGERRAYVDTREGAGATPTQIHSFGEIADLQGMSISPDGQRLVYSVVSTPGTRSVQDLVRTPDASDRVFRLNRSVLHGIAITPMGAGGIQHITTGTFLDLFPSFTPDGEHLLFTSNRRRANGADILRMHSRQRGAIQNILVDAHNNLIAKPTQAGDGTIAYSLYPAGAAPGDDAQIWTLGGPNQYPTQVTHGFLPSISPDGSKIAFIRGGNLWVCDTSGASETQLTYDADSIIADYRDSLPNDAARAFFDQNQLGRTFFPNGYPSWSPDGNYIVYTSMQGRDPTGRPNEDIWVMSVQGTQAEQLTTNFSADRFPQVTPDGRFIYFFSNRGKNWAIWRIAAPENLWVNR